MNEEQNEFSRERFLVVDDDPTISEIVEVYLKMGAAIEVYKAESPLLALRVLQDPQKSIACVICDHSMEPMSGLEFLKNLRTGRYGDARPVRGCRFVMLTASTKAKLLQAAIKLDVHGYITKPFDRLSFTQSIKRALVRNVVLKPASDYRSVDTDVDDP